MRILGVTITRQAAVPAAEPASRWGPPGDRIDKTVTTLLGLQATGHVHVPVSQVLDMLDPGHERREKRDPLADPMTGAMPVDPAAYEKKEDDPGPGGI